MSALIDTEVDNAYVIGAGYEHATYVSALNQYGVDKKKNIERLPVNYDACNPDNDKYKIKEKCGIYNPVRITNSDETINNYLNDTIDVNISNIKGIYKLNSEPDITIHEFMNNLFPILTSPNSIEGGNRKRQISKNKGGTTDEDKLKKLKEASAGFKYQTLLEERLIMMEAMKISNTYKLLKGFLPSFLDNNVFMIASVGNINEGDEKVRNMYIALEQFIFQKNINKIVVMDFGGDIFNYDPVGRDAIMLMMLLLLQQNHSDKFTMSIEVYGPGCDAHAPYDTSIGNITSIVPDIHPSNDDGFIKKFMEFIKNNEGALRSINLTGPGRATGNFLAAYNNKDENINNYIKEYLEVRPDFQEMKDVISSQTTKQVSNFAEIYNIVVNKNNLETIMTNFLIKERFYHSYELLTKRILNSHLKNNPYPDKEYLTYVLKDFNSKETIRKAAVNFENGNDSEENRKMLHMGHVGYTGCGHTPFSLIAQRKWLSIESDKPEYDCVVNHNPFIKIDKSLIKKDMRPLFYKDLDGFVVVINIKLPYIEAYPNDPGAAGMGFVHLLALPKDPIYNIVTLDTGNKKERFDLFTKMRDGVNNLIADETIRTKICDAIDLQIKKHYSNKDYIVEDINDKKIPDIIRKKFEEDKTNFIASLPSFEFFFHAHPNHSVGYLHIHCVSSGEKQRFRTSRLHDHKSIPLDVVLFS